VLVKPLNKAGVRVYVITIGDKVNKDDYEDVVPDKDNANHVRDTRDATNIAPFVVEKIKKDINKRKFALDRILITVSRAQNMNKLIRI
jgi:hypothetical protein